MFAVVLKNTILIFFIVCIGYFLVDNHLNELQNETNNEDNSKKTTSGTKKNVKPNTILKDIINNVQNEFKKPVTISEVNEQETTDIMDISLDQHVKDCVTNPMKFKVDEGMKELYNYVFNDKTANAELTSMYDATKVSNVHKDKSIICETKEQDKIKNMCADPISDHHNEVSYEHIQSTSLPKQSMYDFVDKNI